MLRLTIHRRDCLGDAPAVIPMVVERCYVASLVAEMRQMRSSTSVALVYWLVGDFPIPCDGILLTPLSMGHVSRGPADSG